MTLNILFFTIIIKKHEISVEEAVHLEMVKRLYEENKDRIISVYHF
jgi:uncharacterized protein (TIGR02413 family)